MAGPGSGILSHSLPFGNHGATDGERSTSPYVELSSNCSNYEYHTNDDHVNAINKLLRNLLSRTVEVTDELAEALFPDEAFGFPINSRFIRNFHGSFLNSGYLDPKNFRSDIASTFLNGMVSTIARFLRSTEQSPLENIQPLRYFSSLPPPKPVKESGMMLVRLIDGCTREGTLWWQDLQALVEHTTELEPPIQMVENAIARDYLTFCAQPERNFLINLCITGEGFHIVIADHTGLLETDVIPFDRTTSISIFIRMVMGLAFLPDNFLGIDSTIIRREVGCSSGTKFEAIFSPFTDHSVLQNTGTLRSLAVQPSLVKEIRVKHRTLMRPAGVPVSDFSSLWELMVAFLDVAVAIIYLQARCKIHRDISYTNILLRESGGDAKEIQDAREKFVE